MKILSYDIVIGFPSTNTYSFSDIGDEYFSIAMVSGASLFNNYRNYFINSICRYNRFQLNALDQLSYFFFLGMPPAAYLA